jgi:hypothetical protein
MRGLVNYAPLGLTEQLGIPKEWHIVTKRLALYYEHNTYIMPQRGQDCMTA